MTETEIVERPKKAFAISERGGQIHFTEDEVDAILKTLIAVGGKPTKACEILEEEGLKIERTSLQTWRDTQFPRRYMKLRTEMGRDVAEKIAGNAMERALQADEATQLYIEKAVDKVEEVDANHLAKNALALANAAGQNIEKAQLLRGMPTQHVQVDLEASISLLERLGVAETVDAEVVEEEDV